MIHAPALPTAETSTGSGAGANGFKCWTVQLGGSTKNTGRLVPPRSIVMPMRSAVLDKCIDQLLLVSNDFKTLVVMSAKVAQGCDRHLDSRILRKSVQLIQEAAVHKLHRRIRNVHQKMSSCTGVTTVPAVP